jgi:hypothetical protein
MTAASVAAEIGESTAGRADANPNFWKRMLAAVARSRTRQVEREIASYLELNGGRFTDQMERRILDRVSGLDHRAFGA